MTTAIKFIDSCVYCSLSEICIPLFQSLHVHDPCIGNMYVYIRFALRLLLFFYFDTGDARELVVTKVVTLRDIEQNPSPPQEKWVVKCFKVLDSLQELSPIHEWELADTSHVVLHLDVPNQQLYHLPLLIMRIHCVYLVTFDLQNGEKALETIHKTMNHVSAFVSYNAESLLDNCSPSKVLLVGTHREKLTCKQKRQFAEKLKESLKNRHDDLIVKPDDEEFWTVDGDCIDLQNGPLSKEIILHSCLPKVPTWQCMKYDEELRSMCCQGKKVKTVVKSMLPNVSGANTKKFLTFLHDYGFIVYSPYQELQEEDTTVVLEPEYLCQQFSNAQKLCKKNGKATVADLFSRSPELALNVKKKWFEKFCINMGLVIKQPIRNNEKNLVFVLNRQLQSETGSKVSPACSVDPLLVMVRLQDEDDYYMPPRFFAVFASTFPERLQEKCTEKLRVRVNSMPLRQSHIVVEWIAGCSILVVEQESCIEIGFRLLCNIGCTPKEKLKKLQIRCQKVNEAVDESAKCAVEKLMLPSNECVQYGYYHTCGKIGMRITDSHGTIFECCCHTETPFTPMQKIWFQNLMDCEVC